MNYQIIFDKYYPEENEQKRILTVHSRKVAEKALDARPYRCVRMRLLFRRSALFYAEYNMRLLLKLLLMRADAFYANDSDTLPACCWAARLRGKKLLFDAHELFPDVPELVGKPRVQRVWKWVERTCLPRVDAAFTVSQSVAEEYRRRYGVAMTVVTATESQYTGETAGREAAGQAQTSRACCPWA